jgi:hypothetical protein
MTFPSQSKYVLIGEETTRGTAVVPAQDAGLIITDVNEGINKEVIVSRGISSIETKAINTGLISPDVNFEGEFQHGRMFLYIVGDQNQDVTTGDYKHTFAVSNNPATLTIDSGESLGSAISTLRIAGCVVDSAELSIALNEVLKLSINLQGMNVNSLHTASSAVLSTLPVFPHAWVKCYVNDVLATEVQNASISIAKSVQRNGGISSSFIQQAHPTQLNFEFSANLGFSDKTYQDLFMAGAVSLTTPVPQATGTPAGNKFKICADNGVTLGSGRREISFELENTQYSTLNKTASVGNLTFIEIAGSGTLSSLFTVDNIDYS